MPVNFLVLLKVEKMRMWALRSVAFLCHYVWYIYIYMSVITHLKKKKKKSDFFIKQIQMPVNFLVLLKLEMMRGCGL